MHLWIVFSTRQENEDLKLEYQLLQESYLELERIRDSLQEKNLHYTNVTDVEQELELSKSQASCNYLPVLVSVIYDVVNYNC